MQIKGDTPQNEIRWRNQITWTVVSISQYNFRTGCDTPPSSHKGRGGHTAADKSGKTGVARVLKKIVFFCRETTPEEEEKEEEGPKGWASMKQV